MESVKMVYVRWNTVIIGVVIAIIPGFILG
jgi:hypothetical protein